MRGLLAKRDEVPEVVVCSLSLRQARLRVRLTGVDEVREFDTILNKEDGNVVADDIPVTFLRVKSAGETSDFSRRLSRAGATEDGRETHEHWHLSFEISEDLGVCHVLQACVQLEETVRSVTASVDDAF